jgi:hypothetical protein
MKLLPWSVSISLGIPTLENKLIKALETVLALPRAPLISIPPMDEPFQRIALDFVGPLPMTDSKNRSILVCVDQDLQYSDISLNIPGQKNVA